MRLENIFGRAKRLILNSVAGKLGYNTDVLVRGNFIFKTLNALQREYPD